MHLSQDGPGFKPGYILWLQGVFWVLVSVEDGGGIRGKIVRQVLEVGEVREWECKVEGADLGEGGEIGEEAQGGSGAEGVGVTGVEQGKAFGGAGDG